MTAASGGDGEVAGVHAGRRRRRSGAMANWGDGGEVGREIWGRSSGRGVGGGKPLVKSNIAVARF